MGDDAWTVAACSRGNYLATAVFAGRQLHDLQRYRLPNHVRRLTQLLTDMLDRYGATLLVIEHGTLIERRTRSIGTATQTLTVAAAKELLMPKRLRITQQEFYEHVVDACPPLRRHVTFTAAGGVEESQPWNTTAVLAVALGLTVLRPRPAAKAM